MIKFIINFFDFYIFIYFFKVSEEFLIKFVINIENSINLN